jgi:hypothetical protein
MTVFTDDVRPLVCSSDCYAVIRITSSLTSLYGLLRLLQLQSQTTGCMRAPAEKRAAIHQCANPICCESVVHVDGGTLKYCVSTCRGPQIRLEVLVPIAAGNALHIDTRGIQEPLLRRHTLSSECAWRYIRCRTRGHKSVSCQACCWSAIAMVHPKEALASRARIRQHHHTLCMRLVLHLVVGLLMVRTERRPESTQQLSVAHKRNRRLTCSFAFAHTASGLLSNALLRAPMSQS